MIQIRVVPSLFLKCNIHVHVPFACSSLIYSVIYLRCVKQNVDSSKYMYLVL